MTKPQYVTIPWMKSPFILHVRPKLFSDPTSRWKWSSQEFDLLLEVVLGEYVGRVENDVLEPLHNEECYMYLADMISPFRSHRIPANLSVYSFCWFPHTILHGYPISHNALVTLATQAVDELVAQVPKSGRYIKDFKDAKRWSRAAYRNPFFFLYRADKHKKKWRISADLPIYTYNHDMALNSLAVTTLGDFDRVNKWGLRRPFHIDHCASFRGSDAPKVIQSDIWYDGKRSKRWTYDDVLEGNRLTDKTLVTIPEWGKHLAFRDYLAALQSVAPQYELDSYLARPLRYANA